MPFLIVRNDITKVDADAIVNPSNVDLLEGSGTSRAVFLSAGERKLARACRKIRKCKVGEAVITDAFDLSAKYIVHAVGPVWQDGKHDEEKILYRTYQNSLKLALKKKCDSIAFPLLSSGNYGFPKDRAMKAAVSAFTDFLSEHDMLIYLVLYDKNSFSVGQKLFSDVKEYIDDHYVDENNEFFSDSRRGRERIRSSVFKEDDLRTLCEDDDSPVFYSATGELPTDEVRDKIPAAKVLPTDETRENLPAAAAPVFAAPQMFSDPHPSEQSAKSAKKKKFKKSERSLDELIKNMDETFSQMLLRLIDERGLKDSVVYRKANIDRRHFSKIRNNVNYLPTKRTVFSFAIALELTLDETKDLMNRAGYSISNSSRFDIIVSYFLENGIYDIFEINEVLFAYEEPVLGA